MAYTWINPPVALVSLADAKAFLRITDTAQDAVVTAIYAAAQEAVMAYIDNRDATLTGATTPPAVLQAIRLLLGHYFEHRGDDAIGAGLRQTLTIDDAVWSAIGNLLGRHRTPTVV